MRSRGVSFRHAVELLRNEHPSLNEPTRIVAKGTTEAVKLETPIEVNADDQRVLHQVVDYYHETLKQSPEALKYLEGRGLAHPEMMEQFRIGFSNRTLGYRLPDKNRKSGAEARGRLQQLGVIRESGHEYLTVRWCFRFSLEGDVPGLYGRKITPGLGEGTPLYLYLPGPHRGVWHELALPVSKEIILCEAILDALTFWCAGFRHVTASYGVGGFTADHREAFGKHGVERVWIAYDRDEAGDKAAAALAEELMAWASNVSECCFPRAWTPTNTRVR